MLLTSVTLYDIIYMRRAGLFDPGPSLGGEVPRHIFCCCKVKFMNNLSIFVDESGDFGPYEPHCPFYIFTLVLHEQDHDIYPLIAELERHLIENGLDAAHCFHAGPIIRREEDYATMSITFRRKLLGILTAFARKTGVKYASFQIDKKKSSDPVSLTVGLSKQLSKFLQNNYDFFTSFDNIILYYDNGQIELNRILASVFSIFFANIEFRRVVPSEYRLFQVADLICTFELMSLKSDNNILSASELTFFGSQRDFNRNFVKPIRRMAFKSNQ